MKRAPRGPQLGSRNADRIDAFFVAPSSEAGLPWWLSGKESVC